MNSTTNNGTSRLETSPGTRGFVCRRNSLIHGVGLFAAQSIPRGTRLLEYTGLRCSRQQLAEAHERGETSSRYVMALDDSRVIDGEREGNDARFTNHSCEPNCEVYVFDDIPYLYAMQEIGTGQELTFDYRLRPLDGPMASREEQIAGHPCNCGASSCRATLITPSRVDAAETAVESR